MRKRFEQQLALGQIPVEEVIIPTAKRSGKLPGLCAALKEIFITPEWNERVFKILDNKINSNKNKTGRPGMDLWQIFVLSQVRMCLNISYDELLHISNNDHLIRSIMGVETDYGPNNQEFKYQTIIDNISLLDDSAIKSINKIILEFGHEVFKKKEAAPLCLKTDSFVVESNVHFPTDYNLLWDCFRKCLDTVSWFIDKYQDIPGWRKIRNWYTECKSMMRALGQASKSGGKNKDLHVRVAAKAYLSKVQALEKKLLKSIRNFPVENYIDLAKITGLEHFMLLLAKHIDLVNRRLIKGEKIPHEEKIFSIFEQYTEWITKGKLHPNVELGKKLAITTDQYNLIVDYYNMENEADSEIVLPLADRLLEIFKIRSWSFDKGFWNKDNKLLLKDYIPELTMPKKGKPNKIEKQEENTCVFKRLKNKHSAIESNINELEHNGLNRCPDKGYPNFKRYIGLAVAAYNLQRIGKRLIEIEKQEQQLTQAA